MNSFRRKRDLTRPEAETPLTEADVLADFDELLSTLEQKVSPGPCRAAGIAVQNDFVAESLRGRSPHRSMFDKITGMSRAAKQDCSVRVCC
jgi:hypothetical protein